MIIDTNSDVYKGYIKGINAIKEILEYPITRLDLLILFIGEKLELEKMCIRDRRNSSLVE